MENNTWAFLSANRFWAMVLASASAILVDPSLLMVPWWVSLGKFLGLVSTGFVVTRTIDRAVDHTAEAKVVASGNDTVWFDTEK